jgi:hypothetical protein
MPNWVDIKFTVKGTPEQLRGFMDAVATLPSEAEKTQIPFDFNRFIPMPESLSVESSSVAEDAYAAFYGNPQDALASRSNRTKAASIEALQQALLTTHPNARELADRYHHNIENYGHFTWYSWCNENWGTKWNACDPSVSLKDDHVEVFFQTAWGFPEVVMAKMVAQFPELEFTGTADEEGGHFYLDFTTFDGRLDIVDFSGIRKGGPYDYDDEAEEND